MVALVTPEQANEHLRAGIDTGESPPSPQLSDLLLKIEHASESVLDYLKHDGTPFSAESPPEPWDADTVPATVQAAVLLVLGSFYALREDRPGLDRLGRVEVDLFAPGGIVARLLVRFRDPALA